MFYIIIDIIEALITSIYLCNNSRIQNKKVFILVNTIFTYLIEVCCNYYEDTFILMLVGYVAGWTILLSIFTKGFMPQHLFTALICNFIVDLSALFPLVMAKIISLDILMAHQMLCIISKLLLCVFSYLATRLFNLYNSLDKKDFLLVIIGIAVHLFLIDLSVQQLMETEIISYTSIGILVLELVSFFTTASVFYALNLSAIEKLRIKSELSDTRYKNISIQMINNARYDFDNVQHQFFYQLHVLKNLILDKELNEAIKEIDNYKLKYANKFVKISTNNSVFDSFVTNFLHKSDNIFLQISISQNEKYNKSSFVDFTIELLTRINNHNSDVHLKIKELNEYILFELQSDIPFVDDINNISYDKYDISVVSNCSNDLLVYKFIVSFNI